jgi:hypothetical protein
LRTAEGVWELFCRAKSYICQDKNSGIDPDRQIVSCPVILRDMKKSVPSVAIIVAATIELLSCANVRAQDQLMPQLSDQDPPPDPIFLQQSVIVPPPTSPDAQVADNGIAIVTYAPDSSVSGSTTDGKADVLPGLSPDQVVSVTVSFGAQDAGQTAHAAALDGGILTVPDEGLVVGEDGSVTFQFQVGGDPGLYQVALRDDNREIGVEFWVINNQAPATNPAVDLPQG